MKLFKSRTSLINFQKMYVCSEVYKNFEHNQCAIVHAANNFSILVKIRLGEPVHTGCCFIDNSVICGKDINVEEMGILNSTLDECDIKTVKSQKADRVVVSIFCANVVTAQRLKSSVDTAEKLIKDFLENFIIPVNGIVLCQSVPELQIHSICIEQIDNGENLKLTAYEVTGGTVVSVQNVSSVEALKRDFFPRNKRLLDELFVSTTNHRERTLSKLTRIITDIINAPALPKRLNYGKNLLVVGPSGCGKSCIINFICRQQLMVLLTINCGTTNLASLRKHISETFAKSKLHVEIGEPCIILIKGLDHFGTTKNEQKSTSSRLLIKHLISCLDGIRNMAAIAVVATTSAPEKIDFSLKKPGCFNQEIEIPTLVESDREYTIAVLTRELHMPCSEAVAKAVAKWTPGYILADLLAVVRDAVHLLQKYEITSDDIKRDCFKKAVSRTLPSTLRGTRGLITTRLATFDDIGGLETVKKTLKMCVLWQLSHPEAFERLGIPPTKGILLHGPPGCAKTTLVKALAFESNATFIAVSAADLYSPYVGETEKRLSKLFTQARIGAPSIVFIDEIDALVGNKDGDRDHGVQERILATLLMEMDGVGVTLKTSDSVIKQTEDQTNHSNKEIIKCSKTCQTLQIIVVGATNRPELMDDALKRPGRFDKLLHIPPPDCAERLAVLLKVTSKMVLEDVNLKSLAEKTSGYSGADLKSLCTESALLALSTRGMNAQNVTQEDFEIALANFRPSLLCNS